MKKTVIKFSSFAVLLGAWALYAQVPSVKDAKKTVQKEATQQANAAAADAEAAAKVQSINAALSPLKINFSMASADLDPAGVEEKAVQGAASTINGLTSQIPAGYSIYVIGHASSEGDDAYNLELGRQRAQGVYDRLVKAGVASKHLKVQSQGEKHNKRQVTFELKK